MQKTPNQKILFFFPLLPKKQTEKKSTTTTTTRKIRNKQTKSRFYFLFFYFQKNMNNKKKGPLNKRTKNSVFKKSVFSKRKLRKTIVKNGSRRCYRQQGPQDPPPRSNLRQEKDLHRRRHRHQDRPI